MFLLVFPRSSICIHMSACSVWDPRLYSRCETIRLCCWCDTVVIFWWWSACNIFEMKHIHHNKKKKKKRWSKFAWSLPLLFPVNAAVGLHAHGRWPQGLMSRPGPGLRSKTKSDHIQSGWLRHQAYRKSNRTPKPTETLNTANKT